MCNVVLLFQALAIKIDSNTYKKNVELLISLNRYYNNLYNIILSYITFSKFLTSKYYFIYNLKKAFYLTLNIFHVPI